MPLPTRDGYWVGCGITISVAGGTCMYQFSFTTARYITITFTLSYIGSCHGHSQSVSDWDWQSPSDCRSVTASQRVATSKTNRAWPVTTATISIGMTKSFKSITDDSVSEWFTEQLNTIGGQCRVSQWQTGVELGEQWVVTRWREQCSVFGLKIWVWFAGLVIPCKIIILWSSPLRVGECWIYWVIFTATASTAVSMAGNYVTQMLFKVQTYPCLCFPVSKTIAEGKENQKEDKLDRTRREAIPFSVHLVKSIGCITNNHFLIFRLESWSLWKGVHEWSVIERGVTRGRNTETSLIAWSQFWMMLSARGCSQTDKFTNRTTSDQNQWIWIKRHATSKQQSNWKFTTELRPNQNKQSAFYVLGTLIGVVRLVRFQLPVVWNARLEL